MVKTIMTTQIKHKNFKYIPGLLLTGFVTTIAVYLGNKEWFANIGLSPLSLAILLGIVVGNTIYFVVKPSCTEGIKFAKHYLLRTGIILYGFRLTFQQIMEVGTIGIMIDLIMLTSTFLIALLIGKYFLRLDSQTTILIGAGSSICGAAAVLATESVIKTSADKVTIAVATVVIFGTLAIFVYPWFYHLNQIYHWFSLDLAQFGIFIGSTVHEVAQVVAAGHAISPEAENSAVISKMIRVMMLAPFLLILSSYLNRKMITSNLSQSKPTIVIPWFAIFFIIIAYINSFHLLPQILVQSIITLDTILLSMAMAALGLTTHISVVRQAGIKPLVMAICLFGWLTIGGLFINCLMQSFFQ